MTFRGTRYSDPLRLRVKAGVVGVANDAVGWLRTPVQRPEILLVTGAASEAKIAKVEDRLRFLFSHLGLSAQFRHSITVRPAAYARYAGVVAVEGATIPESVRRHVRWVADLDYDTNSLDGWSLLDFGTALSGRTLKKAIKAGRRTFNSRVRDIEADGPRPVYLFGTGPSLRLAADRSFSDGTTVVCNTIVRDPDLWHHLNPAFFTAGDAIYHFGNTDHARAFRLDALQRLKESAGRTLFVYPAPFDVIVRSEFKEVEELLVPIPWGMHTDMTVDLCRRFSVPKLGNVLNALLLPLGATLSHDVRLWGFDGRAPTDSGFWSNSSRHAYPELMQSLRDAHPAFFAELVPPGNEVQYVKQVHGDWLDERLVEAESRGFEFRMLHPSWTPTLQQRYRDDNRLPSAIPTEHGEFR